MEIQQKEYKVSISMDYNPNVLFSVFVIIGIHQRNPSTKISMDLFSTSEEKINSNADSISATYWNAEYKFISDEGLYNRRAIFRIGPTIDVDQNACCGSFSHVQTVIVISSAGWEQRQPASFQKSAIAGAIPLEEHCFNCRYPIEHWRIEEGPPLRIWFDALSLSLNQIDTTLFYLSRRKAEVHR